jgi:hypothetical protein
MDITRDSASNILDAVQGRKIPGAPPYGPAMMAVASVLATDVDGTTPGISWVDENESFNSLLLTEDQLIHAIVPRDGAPHATAYASPVGAVEAADVRETDGFGALSWYVDTWHVTLQDGTVVTLNSGGDGTRAEDLADFVRQHLLSRM